MCVMSSTSDRMYVRVVKDHQQHLAGRPHPYSAQSLNNGEVQMMKTGDGHDVANGLDRGCADLVDDDRGLSVLSTDFIPAATSSAVIRTPVKES